MFTKNFYTAMAMSFVGAKTYNASPYYNKSVLVNIAGNLSAANSYCNELFKYWGALNYNNESMFPCMERCVSGNSGGGGTYFGTGTTPPTLNDYTFSGDRIRDFSSSSSTTVNIDDNGCEITAVHTITNTGSTAFTIGEVLLVGSDTNTTSDNDTYKYLIERQVLDAPVTIEPGGVGQVTHKVRYNYPTA